MRRIFCNYSKILRSKTVDNRGKTVDNWSGLWITSNFFSIIKNQIYESYPHIWGVHMFQQQMKARGIVRPKGQHQMNKIIPNLSTELFVKRRGLQTLFLGRLRFFTPTFTAIQPFLRNYPHIHRLYY
jgi:hypothetical protein